MIPKMVFEVCRTELDPWLAGVGGARHVADRAAVSARREPDVEQPVVAVAEREAVAKRVHHRGEEKLDPLVRSEPARVEVDPLGVLGVRTKHRGAAARVALLPVEQVARLTAANQAAGVCGAAVLCRAVPPGDGEVAPHVHNVLADRGVEPAAVLGGIHGSGQYVDNISSPNNTRAGGANGEGWGTME